MNINRHPVLLMCCIVLSVSAIVFPSGLRAQASIPEALSLKPVQVASNSIYWGAIMYGKAADPSQFAANGAYTRFEGYAQKKLAIISWGAPWYYNGQFLKFQTSYFDNVRNHGSIPMMNWSSWSCCNFIQPAYALSKIIQGNYDPFIKQWAIDAKNWGHPFFLRLDQEMNGWWQFPWSTQANGNNAAQFVAAWRHIHDIFTKAGALNVTWVWCPNIIDPQTTPLAQVYPGDAYVDWLALDGYNWASKHNIPWASFSELYTASYQAITALSPAKPLMIAEFASIEAGDNGAKKAQWITQALTVDIPITFPKIKAALWFNWDDNSGLSWPIESSAASRAAFAAGINTAPYANNLFGNLNTPKISPNS